MNGEADSYDTLIVDEAHRLNAKSVLYRNLCDNQVKELIRSARRTVFFVDNNQRVTLLERRQPAFTVGLPVRACYDAHEHLRPAAGSLALWRCM